MSEGIPQLGPVQKQSVKDRSYELRDSGAMIPPEAKSILDNRYMNNRLH